MAPLLEVTNTEATPCLLRLTDTKAMPLELGLRHQNYTFFIRINRHVGHTSIQALTNT